jgi:hypothetical protein
MHDEILITIAPAADPAVAHLAALDSAPPIDGPALVASRGGVPVAAVSYAGDAAVADPFVPTAGVVAMLVERAAQLRGVRVRGSLRAWRRGERSLRRQRAARPVRLGGAPLPVPVSASAR